MLPPLIPIDKEQKSVMTQFTLGFIFKKMTTVAQISLKE